MREEGPHGLLHGRTFFTFHLRSASRSVTQSTEVSDIVIPFPGSRLHLSANNSYITMTIPCVYPMRMSYACRLVSSLYPVYVSWISDAILSFHLI